MSPALSQFLNAFRWVAALSVTLTHASNVFVNLSDVMSAPHTSLVYAWWFVAHSQIAQQAVVGFFVMSGYLVGGAVIFSIKRRRPFILEYFIHRFARIYIVLVPTVVCTGLIDWIGRNAFAGQGVYEGLSFAGHYDLLWAGTTLLSLQEIYFPFFGTNGPLWSLACEIWYYITFPLLVLPFATFYSAAVRWSSFAVGVLLFGVLAIPTSFFKFGAILWALGAAATLAPRPLIRSRLLSLVVYVAVLVPIRLLVRGPNLATYPILQDVADLASALAIANLILALRDGPKDGWRALRPLFHKRLSDFSFSLYCVHLPVIIFIRAAASRVLGENWVTSLASWRHFALCLATIALCMIAGQVFSRMTEVHTSAARALLRRYVMPRGTTVAATRSNSGAEQS